MKSDKHEDKNPPIHQPPKSTFDKRLLLLLLPLLIGIIGVIVYRNHSVTPTGEITEIPEEPIIDQNVTNIPNPPQTNPPPPTNPSTDMINIPDPPDNNNSNNNPPKRKPSTNQTPPADKTSKPIKTPRYNNVPSDNTNPSTRNTGTNTTVKTVPASPVLAPTLSISNKNVNINEPISISFGNVADGRVEAGSGEKVSGSSSKYIFKEPGSQTIFLKDAAGNTLDSKEIIINCTTNYADEKIKKMHAAAASLATDRSSNAYIGATESLKNMFTPGSKQRIIFLRRGTDDISEAMNAEEFVDLIMTNTYSNVDLSDYFKSVKSIEVNQRTGKIDLIYLYE